MSMMIQGVKNFFAFVVQSVWFRRTVVSQLVTVTSMRPHLTTGSNLYIYIYIYI